MSAVKPVVVLHPDMATEATKQVLRRAGYAVVTAEDPSHLTIVHALPSPVTADTTLYAAMEAIKGDRYDESRVRFATALAKRVLATEPTKESGS